MDEVEVIAYLRPVDRGTDNECWVVCSKGDPGAEAVYRDEQGVLWLAPEESEANG